MVVVIKKCLYVHLKRDKGKSINKGWKNQYIRVRNFDLWELKYSISLESEKKKI